MKTVKAVSLPLRSCSLWSGAGLALVNFNSIDWTAKSLKVRLCFLMEEIRGGTCFIYSIQGDAYCQKSFIFYFSHEWFMPQLLCAVAPFRGSAIRGLYVFPLAQWLVYTSLLRLGPFLRYFTEMSGEQGSYFSLHMKMQLFDSKC